VTTASSDVSSPLPQEMWRNGTTLLQCLPAPEEEVTSVFTLPVEQGWQWVDSLSCHPIERMTTLCTT